MSGSAQNPLVVVYGLGPDGKPAVSRLRFTDPPTMHGGLAAVPLNSRRNGEAIMDADGNRALRPEVRERLRAWAPR